MSVESTCGELHRLRVEEVHDERDARVTTLEAVTTDLGDWRPEVSGIVDDINLKVQKIAKQCDRVVFDT